MKVVSDRYLPIEDDIARPWTLQHLAAAVEFMHSAVAAGQSETEWAGMISEATKDVSRGGSVKMPMVSVAGQKPLSNS
jgi:hypothetical protein